MKFHDLKYLKRKNAMLLALSLIVFFVGVSMFGIIKIVNAKGHSAAISAMSIQTEEVNQMMELALKPGADSLHIVRKWNLNGLADVSGGKSPASLIIPVLSAYSQINGFLLADSNGNLILLARNESFWYEYCVSGGLPATDVSVPCLMTKYDMDGRPLSSSPGVLPVDAVKELEIPDSVLEPSEMNINWKVSRAGSMLDYESIIFSMQWRNGGRVLSSSVGFSLASAIEKFRKMPFSDHFKVFMVSRERRGIDIFSGKAVPDKLDPEAVVAVLGDWVNRGESLSSPVRMADHGLLYYIQPFSGDKDMYIGILLFEQLMKDGYGNGFSVLTTISFIVSGIGLFMFFAFLVMHRKEEALVAAGSLPRTEKGWLDLIAGGESDSLEFKSSLRWDMVNDVKNTKLEDVIVKTVGAFGNSEGGMLLIGVNDEGEPLGLEKDYSTLKHPNKDAFELHLRELLGTSYSIESAAKIVKLDFPVVSGREICAVSVSPSPSPLFARVTDPKRGKVEKFYIRSGNSSRELENLSEITKYTETHFKKRRK